MTCCFLNISLRKSNVLVLLHVSSQTFSFPLSMSKVLCTSVFFFIQEMLSWILSSKMFLPCKTTDILYIQWNDAQPTMFKMTIQTQKTCNVAISIWRKKKGCPHWMTVGKWWTDLSSLWWPFCVGQVPANLPQDTLRKRSSAGIWQRFYGTDCYWGSTECFQMSSHCFNININSYFIAFILRVRQWKLVKKKRIKVLFCWTDKE